MWVFSILMQLQGGLLFHFVFWLYHDIVGFYECFLYFQLSHVCIIIYGYYHYYHYYYYYYHHYCSLDENEKWFHRCHRTDKAAKLIICTNISINIQLKQWLNSRLESLSRDIRNIISDTLQQTRAHTGHTTDTRKQSLQHIWRMRRE